MKQVELSHLKKAAQALRLFIHQAIKNHAVSSHMGKKLTEEVDQLLQQFEGSKKADSVKVHAFNQLIEKMNQSFLQGQTAFYPQFELSDFSIQLKNEIISFEHYLNQKQRAHALEGKQQELFTQALNLWKDVGFSLSVKEGAMRFSKVVNKFNEPLQAQERFPFDPKFYE